MLNLMTAETSQDRFPVSYCTRFTKAGAPCSRWQTPWPGNAKITDPHACGLHLTDAEREAIRRPRRVPGKFDGKLSSIYFPGVLNARREAAKAATGCTDAYIFEHGLRWLEQEIERAQENYDRKVPCVHPLRWPNSRCQYCYRLPPKLRTPVDPMGVPGALFRSISI